VQSGRRDPRRPRAGPLTGRCARGQRSGRVNCAGPWVDRFAKWRVADGRPRICGRRRGFTASAAHDGSRRLSSADDDRMIFVIPWRDFSAVGPPTPISMETPIGCGRRATR
jgi:glycerol-3-phosphate dehydrogenase